MIPRLRRMLLAGTLVLNACGHPDAFSFSSPRSDSARAGGQFTRLTYNPGQDLAPSWLPDGSGIFYSLQFDARPDRDRCLALLPPAGGTVRRTVCTRLAASEDTTDAWSNPAVATDGGMIFTRLTSVGTEVTPRSGGLMAGRLGREEAAALIRSVPYPGPGGTPVGGISNLQWWGAGRALYLAERVYYAAPCTGCTFDTLRTGDHIVLVDLAGAAPSFTVLPGLTEVSSVSPGATADELYYTLNGDNRVFHHDLTTGVSVPVHDFAGAGIVRDVRVVGTRLVAVAGGRVSWASTPALGLVQLDAGGTLYAVDLATGQETAYVNPDLAVRRPALRPDGRSVALEGYEMHIDGCPNVPTCLDTTISRVADLWLINLP